MLIEFSVSNFRSFREKQTFSMVAAPRLKKRENTFKPLVNGEKLPDLLKVAAIYGPNASGKSNFIKALDVVREVANRQPSAQSIPLPVSQFRFDPQLVDQPSQVELHFIYAETRYQFELSLTQERITTERLITFPKGKETLLYERKHEKMGDVYVFGKTLEGGSDLHEVWKKSTGPQVLFLSQAVANSSEELVQLKHPLNWLQKGLFIVSGTLESWADISQKLAQQHSVFAEEITTFLQTVDVPVSSIRFEAQDSPPVTQGLLGLVTQSKSKSKTVLTHKTVLGEAEFDFNEESEGTKNLIGFWLPWSVHSQSGISKQNLALIVDELDSSLHPEIVKSLVAKHIDNPTSSQLIFTTHDTHLMDTKLLRRDQFWLTERDVNGATQLRSIHDFEGREGEDLEKRYFEGRYRALPILRRG
jgi:hypothetical protein